MFEKEAYEYAKDIFCNVNCSIGHPRARSVNLLDVEQTYIDGAEYGYNKAKEEMQEQGLALQSDMDKTIEQNISLKEQIEKMKAELHHRLVSPSHDDSDCLDKIVGLDRLWQFGQEF